MKSPTDTKYGASIPRRHGTYDDAISITVCFMASYHQRVTKYLRQIEIQAPCACNPTIDASWPTHRGIKAIACCHQASAKEYTNDRMHSHRTVASHHSG